MIAATLVTVYGPRRALSSRLSERRGAASPGKRPFQLRNVPTRQTVHHTRSQTKGWVEIQVWSLQSESQGCRSGPLSQFVQSFQSGRISQSEQRYRSGHFTLISQNTDLLLSVKFPKLQIWSAHSDLQNTGLVSLSPIAQRYKFGLGPSV